MSTPDPLADRIEVRGLELLLFCGVLPEEQERRQPFRLDLDLYLDLAPAGRSDALGDTVDYGAVADRLATVLAGERCQLLEHLAQRAADLVLEAPLVEAVTVRATKLRPPVPNHVATTGVSIHRRRPAPGA